MSSTQELFSFPFPPYPQQAELMKEIHSSIVNSSIACLESPTGSGKTLSIICASLSWLEQEEQRIIQGKTTEQKESSSGEDWLEALLRSSTNAVSSDQARVSSAQARLQRVKTLIASSHLDKPLAGGQSHPFPIETKQSSQSNDGDEYILDAYHSGDEKSATLKDEDALSSSDEEDDARVDFKQILELPQIIYCSRTHSQLSQFVQEIKKTRFKDIARCVVLASRKHSCINPAVKRLAHEQLINEKCQDLAKASTKTATNPLKKSKGNQETKCPHHNRRREANLSYRLANGPHDLEDVLDLGHRHQACPYYASKAAVSHCNVLCTPYSTLLHHDLRAAYQISINRNAVVVIDEAHNVIDAINSLYSAEVSALSMSTALDAVMRYLTTYRARLSGKNMYYLNVLAVVLKKIRDHLTSHQASSSSTATTSSMVNDFLFRVGLDHINLFKLQRYLHASNIATKIGGFAMSFSPSATQPPTMNARVALRSVLQLIFCLTNQDADGRLFLVANNVPGDESSQRASPEGVEGVSVVLKYVMLHPGRYFEAIIRDARAVLLVGGTLQPFHHLSQTLLRGVEASRLRLFACGHIVPREQVKPLVLAATTDGRPLEITFSSRLSVATTDAIYRALLDLAVMVPAGMVVFFTSYHYMHTLLARWRSDGKLNALHAVKPLFSETNAQHRGEGEEAEGGGSSLSVWERYRLAIQNGGPRGAILCSVMGGSLSEGINFSDDLARAVVVVGMPYPDPRDAILQEKLKFTIQHSTPPCGTAATTSSALTTTMTDLYDAMCMKTVNQSIGRAIRHVHDYAAIVLLDARYRQPRIHQLLPGWIRNSMLAKPTGCYGEVMENVRDFFAVRRAPER